MPDRGADWHLPDDPDAAPRCDRCDTQVSHTFFRIWSTDDTLPACPECAPRAIRWGEDVYDRDLDDIEDFDKDRHNLGKDPGGIEPTPDGQTDK